MKPLEGGFKVVGMNGSMDQLDVIGCYCSSVQNIGQYTLHMCIVF
jgi:hypothetical protein